jgi:type VI secretion system protein ImpA
MPSNEVLDFARLLASIPGESPGGIDLRADASPVSDYHTIREARKIARAAERLLEVPPDGEEERGRISPPNWGTVLEQGTKILATRSKDLEITAYVIEALVRVHGFPGLRDGYRLARELIEKYWDMLFPAPVDSDTESRFKLLLDLSGVGTKGALEDPIFKIPFTGQTSAGSYTTTHYNQAKRLGQIADEKLRKQKIADGAVSSEMIQNAIALTPAQFYVDLVDDIFKSQEEFRQFCETLSAKSGYAPPSSDLERGLESYLDIVKDAARDKLPKTAPSKLTGPVPQETSPAGQTPTAPAADPSVIRDRADAMDRLLKVAAYFREREPQSIIPYALEQVVRWSNLSLPELLSELIPEDAPRKNLYKQVGIRSADAGARPPEPKK